jgi:beta-carotene ketolase (CrtW type)
LLPSTCSLRLQSCSSSVADFPLRVLEHQKGLLVAAVLFLCWLSSLIWLLHCQISSLPLWSVAAAVLLRTALQTSLFITGHDAMHGLLLPACPRWNQRLGALALSLYAGLTYQTCLCNHRLHHQLTATSRDPDFNRYRSIGFWGWYLRFMTCYLSWRQFARLCGGWFFLLGYSVCLDASCWKNFILFCIVPLCLSSLQLFTFGTYLPHRVQKPPFSQNQPDSLDLPPWLSLLACFHFGYHREHHDNPALAWYELPAQRRRQSQLLAQVRLSV